MIFIIELIFNIIEMQFILRYYFTIYKPSKSPLKMRVISVFIIIMITCVLRIILNSIRPVDLPPITIITSFLFLPFLEAAWKKKVLFSSILIGISIAWTLLMDLIVTPIPNKNLLDIWMMYLSMHFGFWLILELLGRIGNKKHQQVPQYLWIILMVISTLNFIIIVIVESNVIKRSNPYQLTTEIPVLFALLMINLTLFIFFDRFSELLEKGKEQSLLEQQLSLQSEHYSQLESYQQQISSLHHDIKNYINAAINLAGSGMDKEKLLNCLEKVNGNLMQIDQTITTGNPQMDSVINLKLSQIRYAGIPYKTEIHIPGGLTVSFEDSVVIFGNLLDNAREACEKLTSDNRWIHLLITYSNNALYIKIDNSVLESNKNNKDLLPATIKSDKFLHGFGLKNVKQLVDENGTMIIDQSKPGIFSIRIMLYLS